MIDVKVYLEEGARVPEYKTEGASGADLFAFLPDGDVTIRKGEAKNIPTGVHFGMPEGYEVQIRPRSGLAFKNNVNTFWGTIDEDYKGGCGVRLFNECGDDIVIHNGDRVAQAVVAPVTKGNFVKVEDIEDIGSSVRGQNGFGSTGI